MSESDDTNGDRNDAASDRKAIFWQMQIAMAEADQRDFVDCGSKVVSRYKSERKSASQRGAGRKFNILYSNTEVLRSALYGRAAKPDVRRRFSDQDPVGRQAAEVVERGLIYCADSYDVDSVIDAAVQDYLLPGRGVIRVDYDPVLTEQPVIDPLTAMPTEQTEEVITQQKLYLSYVFWKDYLQSPARNEDGVWWRAFRHTFTREELEENKFVDAEMLPMNWEPNMDSKDDRKAPDSLKKAEVWEIWDKSKRQRVWIMKGYPKALRVDDDPLGLEEFFPCAPPLLGYTTNDTQIPEPEFHAYQDQADDLDEITARISRLTKAMKRRGVYDQSVKELKRLANANDNEFIPVENYQKLSEKGGLTAAFQTEDISIIAKVLLELYKQRDMLVQTIYEVTGISDIVRGATDANETLGAQELKAQFGSQRMKRRQRAVQRWIRDTYKLKAEIIAEHFQPDVLSEMTGVQVTPEVIELLRSDKLRSYRIDIETDSTIFEDAQQEQKQRTELLTAITMFMEKWGPIVAAQPELLDLAFELLAFAVRGFKAGRSMEEKIEETKQKLIEKAQAAAQAAAQQPPPPDPEAEKLKAEMEMEREKHGMDMQGKQVDLQVKQVGAQIDMQKMQAQAALNAQQAMMPRAPETVQ